MGYRHLKTQLAEAEERTILREREHASCFYGRHIDVTRMAETRNEYRISATILRGKRLFGRRPGCEGNIKIDVRKIC